MVNSVNMNPSRFTSNTIESNINSKPNILKTNMPIAQRPKTQMKPIRLGPNGNNSHQSTPNDDKN